MAANVTIHAREGAQRPSVRRWLASARHPTRCDGLIAAALLLLPWALWALAPHHRFDASAVTILVTVSISLIGLWFTWAGFRMASRAAPADSGTGPGIVTAWPGFVVADGEETAIGRVVYQQRRGVTEKPVRLADPPPLLAGREDLLAELDTRLTGGDDPAPRTVALCGLGGAGKTSVALAYAHRHLTEVGVAWQFSAEDATVLAAGFGELAAQLGARALADIQDPMALVHAVLARFATPWLLIFDSAADIGLCGGFPAPGRARAGVDHQPEPCLARPPAGCSDARPGRRGGFPGQPHR